MSYRIQVIHTEDKKLTREGTSAMLNPEGIDIVGEASNGLELFRLLKKTIPDIILLDLEMPVMDGNITLRELKIKYPKIKVIILTSFTEDALIEDFKDKGATAFLSKDCDYKTIANTIKKVFYSETYHNFPKKFKSLFTPREIEIIPHLLAGRTSKQIAKFLGISFRTVEAIRDRAYSKAKCKNGPEFAGYCTTAGLQYLGFKNDLNKLFKI